jgi:Flp pilus assembly protein TadD
MRAAVERKPERTEYQINLARLLAKSGEYDAALQAALVALKLEPGSANVHATIAGIYHPWREDLAEEAARRAIALDPSSHAGHGNLAASLWGQGKLEEAAKHGREATRLRPAHIGYRTNLGLILKDLGELKEARALYHGMVDEAAQHPKLAMDLGTLAIECDGDLEAARAWYCKAQAASDDPRAFLSEAILDLLEQRFETGWDKYEARKRVADQRYQHSIFAHLPAWNGESDCRLLVYGEQGLGDEIMYAAMLRQLSPRVRRITLMCDSRLGALFQRSFPELEVVAEPRATQGERVKALQHIDAVIAAGSLGRLFRHSVNDFPRHDGYLAADPAKVSAWKERLGAGRHFGISWIGGLQKTGRSRRSVPLERLHSLLGAVQASWVSLQHDFAGSGLVEFPGVTQDLDELASLISALDLVVSVCNTTVHLAGALGKEVIVLAPFVPEWRYGLSGEMLWYPSARVLRQATYGDWQDVLARLDALLRTRAGT